ncbi:MAG TPA: DUF2142 domain-containing protein, partial [Candidatus Saccharimonadales bacterium]|nr:DUF2142 domain-containing protein [Candidatus Saccharimonadales bacterium]
MNITKVSSRITRISPSRFFLVCALVFGLSFLIFTPPFNVPDEQAHFFRAYQISEGSFVAKKIPQGVGGYLPWNLLTTANTLIGDMPGNPTHKANVPAILQHFSVPLNPRQRGNVHFENTALYSPLMYAPAAVGMKIASLFGASPLVFFYVGRLCTFAAWLGLVYLAIRMLPRAKWVLVVLGLSPMALFQAASLSADAITMGFCLLTIAWFVRLAMQESPLSRKQWAATLLLACCMGFIKQPYGLVALIFALLPAARFTSKRQWFAGVGSILGVLMAPFLVWASISQRLYVQSPFLTNVVLDPHAQLQFVLHHPVSYAHVALFTHLSPFSDDLFRQFVGVFGWLDTPLPWWTVLAYLFCILLAIGSGERLHLQRKQR